MRNLFTITRRELAAYFNSPIGYIFIIVFVILNTIFFIDIFRFFAIPRASMRNMFEILPFICCIFIPLITMRLWAEDRKENTIEMLLTFPMQPHELVLGKYLASFVFYLLAIFGTVTIPIMIGVLGDPDWGIIFNSYIGSLLLGGLFLSIGIFVSGFVKDQIVAAVLSILACLSIFLLGTDGVASTLDSNLYDGLGSLLQQMVAVTKHYQNFTKGIFEATSFLYFVTWIAVFLFLNGFSLEGRGRAQHGFVFSLSVVMCFGIGVACNYLFNDLSLGRFDLTKDKIHTVSDATIDILKDLDSPMQVKLYISPKDDMPTGFKELEQSVVDTLEEIRLKSSGKLRYTVVNLRASRLTDKMEKALKDLVENKNEDANKEKEQREREKSLEEKLLNKGVRPNPLAVSERGDRQTTRLVYTSLGIEYKDKERVIESIAHPSGSVIPTLEYHLMKIISQLQQDKKPVVVLHAPGLSPKIKKALQQMRRPMPNVNPYQTVEAFLNREGYEVKKIDFNKNDALPKEFDALVIINPYELDDRQRWEIARALHNGKSVFLAVQQYVYNYEVEKDNLVITQNENEPKANMLLQQYGVTVDDNILMDENFMILSIPVKNPRTVQEAMQGYPVEMPTHIDVLQDSLNKESSITNRLDRIFYLWGTCIKIDKDRLAEHKLDYKVLMNTSKKAWKLIKGRKLTLADREPPTADQQQQYPLMVMVEGQFPDLFKDKKVPDWAEEEPSFMMPPRPNPGAVVGDFEREASPKPGKLILMGCSQTFDDNILGFTQSGISLLGKSMHVLALNENLAKINPKSIPTRPITRPEVWIVSMWKWINYLAIPLLTALIGIIWSFIRKWGREEYSKSMQ